MLVFTWDENNYMHFFQSHLIFLVKKLTMCLPKLIFTPYPTLSLSTQHKQIYFLDLAQLKDLLHQMQLKPKKRTIIIDTSIINISP